MEAWSLETAELGVDRTGQREFFKRMGVYKKAPRDVAKKMSCKVITRKCVDTNKGYSSGQTIEGGLLVAR